MKISLLWRPRSVAITRNLSQNRIRKRPAPPKATGSHCGAPVVRPYCSPTRQQPCHPLSFNGTDLYRMYANSITSPWTIMLLDASVPVLHWLDMRPNTIDNCSSIINANEATSFSVLRWPHSCWKCFERHGKMFIKESGHGYRTAGLQLY